MTDHPNDTVSAESLARSIGLRVENLRSLGRDTEHVDFIFSKDEYETIIATLAAHPIRTVTALSEEEIAALIKEHVTVGYEFAPGTEGLVNPETIFIQALGAAHVIAHRMRAYSPDSKLREALIQIAAVCKDNVPDTCNHAMALAFVYSVADKAISSGLRDGENG